MTKTIGLATLLTGKGKQKVLEFWDVFEEEYNSVGVQSFDYPNLGFQGGSCKDINSLIEDLIELCKKVRSFEFETHGIGYFEDTANVVYLSVDKNPNLKELHNDLNSLMKRHCDNIFKLYEPDNWVPHITLAMQDLSDDDLNRFKSEYKNAQNFNQEINNIALVEFKTDGDVELLEKIDIL
ncbi:2'-5' RNA ligase family protein [Halobacillus salinus]|uniref:2'-5' RNA ligase family protein n=1 Tax=Halobacillus salinus TaxID=192814 RepID=UPI001305293F|nr:2'-5' RNA ligase family protein [Halobacillus salinus]